MKEFNIAKCKTRLNNLEIIISGSVKKHRETLKEALWMKYLIYNVKKILRMCESCS
jgi:hypothetical protein